MLRELTLHRLTTMNVPIRNLLRAVAALALGSLLFLASGCASPEFASKWRAASRDCCPTGIEGAWKGTWKSEATGHTGDLKLVVTRAPEPGRENQYDFHYWASWAKILAGDYSVTYAVREERGKYRVAGEKDLGRFLGGLYSHEGVATPERFDATYKAEKDHGSFTMTRR